MTVAHLAATQSGEYGHLLQALIPALTGATATASAGGFDIAAALDQAAGGGVTGVPGHNAAREVIRDTSLFGRLLRRA